MKIYIVTYQEGYFDSAHSTKEKAEKRAEQKSFSLSMSGSNNCRTEVKETEIE